MNLPATGAALVAAVLIGAAMLTMTGTAPEDLRLAGFLFLSGALVIYLRETYLVDD